MIAAPSPVVVSADASTLTARAAAPAASAAGAEPLVRFTGVQKTYDGVQLVVKQLDLDIQRGEFLTLLGPSGSGKTTTLMMLAGFESPTAGDILLDGKPITRTPPHKRNFGMVFQNYALFPHLSIAQNVAYPLTVRKVPKAEMAQRVARALDMVRLKNMDDRLPGQLSGGQQQRVALARALVFQPQLVLMDEPLGALDKQLREHMQIELKELHRELGVTFVYVTHDQSEALTMSDRVAVFNDGVIQQLDAVDRMYEAPANGFVASFIGDSTMLHGTVRATQVDGLADRCGVVLTDGRVLTGLNVNGAAVGARVQACIRPERVAVHAHAPADHANLLQAEVRNLIYFGDHLRLLCHVGEGQALATAKLPLSAPVVPQPGASVWLELAPELTRIYA